MKERKEKGREEGGKRKIYDIHCSLSRIICN